MTERLRPAGLRLERQELVHQSRRGNPFLQPPERQVGPVVGGAKRVSNQLDGVVGPKGVEAEPMLKIYEVRKHRMLRARHGYSLTVVHRQRHVRMGGIHRLAVRISVIMSSMRRHVGIAALGLLLVTAAVGGFFIWRGTATSSAAPVVVDDAATPSG